MTEDTVGEPRIPAPEAAETARLAEAVNAILPALERFNRFEGLDRTAHDRDRWVAALDAPLPRRGEGLDAVIEALTTSVIPYGLRNGAPAFTGWVTTAPTTAGAVASLAAKVAGSQRYWMHAFNLLEDVALRWLAELLRLPPGMAGLFTGGGSSANLVALGAARQHAFERLGVDVGADGIPVGTRARVYASDEVHHVVTRAAGVLGLGRRSVVAIPSDEEHRLDVSALRERLEDDLAAGILPVAIVATAGTVNTGSVDPIADAVVLAREHDVWLHVDGAYGGFGILDERVAHLFAGMERADSMAVDPHKWLAAPLGCGATYVRDADLLARAFTLEPAEYIEGGLWSGEIGSPFDGMGIAQYHHLGVDQSAPSRGVTVWAILKEIGAEGVRDRIARHNGFAQRLADRVAADERLELLAEPVLSICCFRYVVPGLDGAALDELNQRISARLRAETPHVPSTTRVHGRLAIRPCYIGPRTTEAEVDDLAVQVRRIGDELTRAAT